MNQKLHRKGKQWFTVLATALALLGAGSSANKSANVDSLSNYYGDYDNAKVDIEELDNGTFANIVRNEVNNKKTVGQIRNDNDINDIKNKYINGSGIIGFLKPRISQTYYSLKNANISSDGIYVKVDGSNKNSDLSSGILTIHYINNSEIHSDTISFNANDNSNISNIVNKLEERINTGDNEKIDTNSPISLTSNGNNNYTVTVPVSINILVAVLSFLMMVVHLITIKTS